MLVTHWCMQEDTCDPGLRGHGCLQGGMGRVGHLQYQTIQLKEWEGIALVQCDLIKYQHKPHLGEIYITQAVMLSLRIQR